MRKSGSGGELSRELGVGAAVMLGLGSIVGTGVFVSIGIAAGVAGPALVPAIVLAALVASCNGMSSAQLAATHPVSGGTYEYGYRFLNPILGFIAGVMFLSAKSASAATAALGAAGYTLRLFSNAEAPIPAAALGIVVVITLIVAAGIRRSTRTNTVIVSITLAALIAFVAMGMFAQGGLRLASFRPFFADTRAPVGSLLNAAALMFVAYTGYGRIATLGEEVRSPRRTIPRAIVASLAISMLLYTAVAAVAVSVLGAGELAASTGGGAAPLEIAARRLGLPVLAGVLAVGAITAMIGVLLNLLLGLSRVVLAMARRGDMPIYFRRVHAASGSPRRAVFLVAAIIIVLVAIGDVRITWSFSAFTVLVYYTLTNLAALFVAPEERLFPRWISLAGMAGCLSLAAFIPPLIIAVGGGLILLTVLWFVIARHIRARRIRGHASS